MRITLDTNVLVSAFISKSGQPAAVLDAILTFPEIELVLSDQILRELRDVLLRREVRARFGYSVSDTDAFVNALRAVCGLVRSQTSKWWLMIPKITLSSIRHMMAVPIT